MLTYMSHGFEKVVDKVQDGGMVLGGWSYSIGAIFEPAFITGSLETYNNFHRIQQVRYLLTKKLQANYSPGFWWWFNIM